MFLKSNIFISILAGTVPALITVGYKIFGPLIFFFSYFTPLPFFLVSLKFNYFSLIISIFSSILFIILFASTNTAILFFIINALPALIISFEKLNKKHIYYGNIISKISICKCLIYFIISFFYSKNIEEFSKAFHKNLQALTKNDLIINDNILTLIPSVIIASWIIILVLNLIIAKNLLFKYEKSSQIKDKLIDIIIPNWFIILFILLLLPITVFNLNFPILISAAIIISIPITIQGLTILHFAAKKINYGNFFLYSLYGLIFFIPISLSIVTALGILDNFYNFRKLHK